MAAFDEFADDFHDHFTTDANERVFAGVDRDLGELPDPSIGANQRRVTSATSLLERANALANAELSWDQSLDRELAALMLESEIHTRELKLGDAPQLVQLPRGGDDVGDGLFLLMANDPRPAEQRLADISARIAAIPDYFSALTKRTEKPVKRWADMDKQKVEALPGLLDAALAFAQDNQLADRGELKKSADRARVAMATYVADLADKETSTALHLDEADARKLVKLRGIDPSFEELHSIATEFLGETRQTLAELRSRLAPKYGLPADISLADLHKFLNEKFAVVGADAAIRTGSDDSAALAPVLDRYRAERARVLAFIEEKNLFEILPDQEMKILSTPAFLVPSIPAGAMMPPAPFRQGTRTSLIYLTIRADQLDDHTELGIPGMMIHEGIPGHHLQLATASTHDSIIRRHVSASEQAEGWTTMLEDYMLDLGYMGELTDEARFCGKRDLSRIGARVVIDLFFMTGERSFLEVGADCDTSSADPFVAAGNVLAEVTGFNPGRVEGELNWYSQERGYPLCYLTGNRLVWQMKTDAANGPHGPGSLDLDRRFHQSYLTAGNMPLSFLRRVMIRDGLITEGA